MKYIIAKKIVTAIEKEVFNINIGIHTIRNLTRILTDRGDRTQGRISDFPVYEEVVKHGYFRLKHTRFGGVRSIMGVGKITTKDHSLPEPLDGVGSFPVIHGVTAYGVMEMLHKREQIRPAGPLIDNGECSF